MFFLCANLVFSLLSMHVTFICLYLVYCSFLPLPRVYNKASATATKRYKYILFVSFFGVLRPTREFFHSYGDVTISCKGLHILAYTQHSWPLSSDGSLACQTYCNAGHLFIMAISADLRHSHILLSV